ncbi:hypothetical protein HPB50_013589 [Hyalomma asiaticum]|uniref:Uncharacterized protein n=1 Tax=Hyalomma asiaticum TaxID=266040 RepID=A0ACB7RYU1_HYAAI|nr:hypothetical protein HPB50_013589 [Hyalomma asiaticum]
MDYNRRLCTRPQSILQPGQNVWVTDSRCTPRVMRRGQRPGCYVVETPNGVIQRNRLLRLLIRRRHRQGRRRWRQLKMRENCK